MVSYIEDGLYKIFETLDHTDKDDKELDRVMERSYRLRTYDHQYVGTIGNLKVVSTNYPYGLKYFFLHDDNPVGFAIVQRGGRAIWKLIGIVSL